MFKFSESTKRKLGNAIVYIARHSWASIAQDRKVSTDIIREGLGHDNEKTTHIYLASISTSQIDRANQIILRGL